MGERQPATLKAVAARGGGTGSKGRRYWQQRTKGRAAAA